MTTKKQDRFLKTDQNALRAAFSPGRLGFLSISPEQLSAGGRIRRERILRNMTQEEMASYLDISASYLGAIERGSRPLSKKMMEVIHDRLKVSYDFLMEGRFMTGAMIQQFVREEPSSDSVYKTNVLLKAEPPQVQDACYEMVHSYLTSLHSAERKS